MTKHPHGQATHDADPMEKGTPAGVVEDIVEEAEETGGSTDPADSPEGRKQLEED